MNAVALTENVTASRNEIRTLITSMLNLPEEQCHFWQISVEHSRIPIIQSAEKTMRVCKDWSHE